MRRLQSFIDRFVNNHTAAQIVGTWILPAGFSGTIIGWLATWVSALHQYAPLSYVAAGIIGAFVVTLITLAIAIAWSVYNVGLLYSLARSKAYTVNILDSDFTKSRISLNDFAMTLPRPHKGKTFIDCELIGPAVIALVGNTYMADVQFVECDFVEMAPGSRVSNVILFEDITMRPEGLNWITHRRQPQVSPQEQAA